jgi:hypothetical protein
MAATLLVSDWVENGGAYFYLHPLQDRRTAFVGSPVREQALLAMPFRAFV